MYFREQINLKAPCNAGCHCGEQQFYPVCSHDDFMFFSPCMAGCLNETINDGSKVCVGIYGSKVCVGIYGSKVCVGIYGSKVCVSIYMAVRYVWAYMAVRYVWAYMAVRYV